MTELPPEPGLSPSPARAPAPDASRRQWWLGAVLPYALTVVIAVALSTSIQAIVTPAPATPIAATSPTTILITPTQPTAASMADSTITPTPLRGILQQELIDLRAEDNRIWTAIYLVRAISQVADAEAALRVNDLAGVEQSLVAMDDSLMLAYERASDPAKNPIDELRRQVGMLREDLYLRPEGMDTDLFQLRQTIRALIEEREQ